MPERLLIAADYRELRAQRPQGALALFHFCAELYPAEWEAYDALGDAYAKVGDKGAASANWRRSSALNPKNVDALEKIAKLGLAEPDAR